MFKNRKTILNNDDFLGKYKRLKELKTRFLRKNTTNWLKGAQFI